MSPNESPLRATPEAWTRAEAAGAVILVEGISDQLAVSASARSMGRSLQSERVVILPVGGAGSFGTYMSRLKDLGIGFVGLCDVGEESLVLHHFAQASLGNPQSRDDLAALGFFVCVDDLEDELIRAVGAPQVEEVFQLQGDLRSFRSMQNQPAWRGQPIEAQMRRFLGAGARRKTRYAKLLVETLDPDLIPRPLSSVVAAV